MFNFFKKFFFNGKSRKLTRSVSYKNQQFFVDGDCNVQEGLTFIDGKPFGPCVVETPAKPVEQDQPYNPN